MRNVSDRCRRENQNRHFMFKNYFSAIAANEKMWENTVERDRPRMTIRRMRIACWLPKATNKHTQSFPQQQWLHESFNVTL
jgi:hypothetical protein